MKDFFEHQTIENYEKSHKRRLDFIVERFFKDTKDKTIVDVGGGFGPLLNRIDKSNKRISVDFTSVQPYSDIEYYQTDLNFPFAETFLENHSLADYVVSLETIEHLMSPYLLLLECKKILKIGGKLLLSCPENNNFGEGHIFLWKNALEKDNIIDSAAQLSLHLLEYEVHTKDHVQQVFLFENRTQDQAVWINHKREYIGKEIFPHELVNL